MTRIAYIEKRFAVATLATIDRANAIIREYAAQGFALTLRQLYYQFVARDLIPNTQASYKRLGSVVNDARLAGLIDWEAIEDRTRFIREAAHWDEPGDIVEACAKQFRVDRWETQPYRPEVWIEKDALVGVFEDVCDRFDVPLFSCRGYTSQSEMWRAARRLRRHARANEQRPIVLHFGDHDPSGQDMSRDIKDRLSLFGTPLTFRRLALNMNQIEEYGPPPNPAKITDSRFEAYRDEYGSDSWELDALEPAILAGLAEEALQDLIDEEPWLEREDAIEQGRATLAAIGERFADVQAFLEEEGDR